MGSPTLQMVILLVICLTEGFAKPFTITNVASEVKKDLLAYMWNHLPSFSERNTENRPVQAITTTTTTANIATTISPSTSPTIPRTTESSNQLPEDGRCTDPRSPCKCRTRTEWINKVPLTHHMCDVKANKRRSFPKNLECRQISEESSKHPGHKRHIGCELRCVDKCRKFGIKEIWIWCKTAYYAIQKWLRLVEVRKLRPELGFEPITFGLLESPTLS